MAVFTRSEPATICLQKERQYFISLFSYVYFSTMYLYNFLDLTFTKVKNL